MSEISSNDKRINIQADSRRNIYVMVIYSFLSLFLFAILAVCINSGCGELEALLKSKYTYSAISSKSVSENDYYQFNAGIDFSLSADSGVRLNADIIMQSDLSVYDEMIHWNAGKLEEDEIAISKKLAKSNKLKAGDSLFSKHIVDGTIREYKIKQIIPDINCVRNADVNSFYDGVLIMGFDRLYLDNISHVSVFFTDKSVEEFSSLYSQPVNEIVYRTDEIRKVVIRIVPYIAAGMLLEIILTIILAVLLCRDISCEYKRLVKNGLDLRRLKSLYGSFLFTRGSICVVVSIFLSVIIMMIRSSAVFTMLAVLVISIVDLFAFVLTGKTLKKRMMRG